MVEHTRNFLKTFVGSDFNKKSYLLAVSGGVDSMVAAFVFQQLGVTFFVAHCNFKLRNNASDKDEQLVIDFAKKNNISVFTKQFDTSGYAKQNGISIQMAARDLRYNYFNHLIKTNHIDFLVTAHHADDQAETILLNLIRGTGIKGLRGILPKNNHIIRPFLNIEKQTIIDFAEKENIPYRTDESNLSTKYKRNALRHLVIPELKKINPNFITESATFGEKMTATAAIFNEKVKEEQKKYVQIDNDNIIIDFSFTENLNHATTYLYEWINHLGFNYSQISDMIAQKNHSGALFFANEYVANINRNQLLISKQNNASVYYKAASLDELKKLPFLDVSLKPFSAFTLQKTNDLAQLDFDKISFPITIRTWQNGDKFIPLGMTGFKKLSDFFTDIKLPVTQKKSILIFENGNNEIFWIGGLRQDNRFKITDKTKKVLLLKIKDSTY